MSKKVKIALVGIGNRNKKYLSVINKSKEYELCGIADSNSKNLENINVQVPKYSNISDMIANVHADVALIALPHKSHLNNTIKFLNSGCHVIKEKPYACSYTEALALQEAEKKTHKYIYSIAQRRYSTVYQSFPKLFKKRMGDILYFNAYYTKNIKNPNTKWRSSFFQARGGVLLDMGYHYIDIILWYFGFPSTCDAKLQFHAHKNHNYDSEDTAQLLFSFNGKQPQIIGTLTISRLSHQEKEEIRINGTNGYAIITKETATLYNNDHTVLTSLENISDEELLLNMLEKFAQNIRNETKIDNNLKNIQLIDEVYKDYYNNSVLQKNYEDYQIENTHKNMIEDSHFQWPIITKAVEKCAVNQLQKGLLTYKRGILKKFEEEYAAYHSKKFALLSNSGTSALFSIFEGINLQPEDEVICPAYTFFATISPIIYTGAKVIFVDCDFDGNINPNEIKHKISSKTKAIVLTHMWGIPCDMESIIKICKEKNIALIEDCSHAHGAKFKNKICGSFGEASAWSLQGKKIVSGGEGGIMITNNENLFYRAVLQGHYNKRCKQEIAPSHSLYEFSLTGLGQNFRPHPIAMAIAYQQFQHLEEWQVQRHIYAMEILDVLSNFNFITLPNIKDRLPSWYALVFQVNEKCSVSALEVYKMLQDNGLKAVDRPDSTRPIYNLPLFTKTHTIMPRLYKVPCVSYFDNYPVADYFFDRSIKLPIWSLPSHRYIVNFYKDTLNNIFKTLQRRNHHD